VATMPVAKVLQMPPDTLDLAGALELVGKQPRPPRPSLLQAARVFGMVDEQKLLAEAEIMIRGATLADRTRKFYAQNWGDFQTWCTAVGKEALPASPETLLLYLTGLLMAPRKVTTVRRYLTAIRHYHVKDGYQSPINSTITALIKGAQRLRSERVTQKRPITTDLLRRMSTALPTSHPFATPRPSRAYGIGGRASRGWSLSPVMVARNRAVLLLGFASALRRSSLCRLNMADVTIDEHGALLEIHNEKQDRRGSGRLLAVGRAEHTETCPVQALEKWIALRGTADGPLFTPAFGRHAFTRRLHPSTIASIVKRAAASIGLDPAKYAGHSLRSGFVTSAFECGIGQIAISEQTGHRSLNSLRRYVRKSDPFKGNASTMVGL
jgi:integrase